MPGTTRYSATFDRTYEEDDRVAPEPVATRRSRSQSWQANCGTDGRPYTPLAGLKPSQRSSSTDSKGAENIPTRTVAKTAVKAHNNPFQFVKVGSCPLYRKAEEQLKKVKEVKKPEVLKEEEEEWQSNLDSWKSRRRKMSEDVFRRQEEIKQLELEEQIAQANLKKTKTFSEMVESRAHRGRALSLCLISSPLELQDWEFENKSILKSHFLGGSEGNSTVNSEDEGVNLKGMMHDSEQTEVQDTNHKVNSNNHVMNNGSVRNGSNKYPELHSNNLTSSHKEGAYIDSGLESISSSHRAGDTPDSGSDFSQDSGSSLDCDSPRVSGLTLLGANLLEDYGKSLSKSDGDHSLKEKSSCDALDKLCLNNKNEEHALSFAGGKVNGMPILEAVESENMLKDSTEINGCNSDSEKLTKENTKKAFEAQKGHSKLANNKKIENSAHVPDILPKMSQQHEKSIESENEMYVDDFDELKAKHSVQSVQPPGPVVTNNQEKETLALNVKSSKDSSGSSKFLTKEVVVTPVVDFSKHADKNSLIEKIDNASANLDVEPLQNALKSKSGLLEEKTKPVSGKKKPKTKSSKKKATSAIQKTTASNESELSVQTQNPDSLNIVFESQPVSKKTSEITVNGIQQTSSNAEQIQQLSMKNDILPVEKIAEEMEKLILEQLEEEERAKELASEMSAKSTLCNSDHLVAPPRQIEPPKEKPPPPPTNSNETQKSGSLKRVNSTKRIKKEIHKRRSNFLGIENSEENVAGDESSIPPPPALEEILKAEMELDRESRRKLESAADQRLTSEEKEIIKKEREIIETLESEERQKHLMNSCEELNDIQSENDRIQTLKEERKRMEEERLYNEEQRLRLIEEKQLREREEYIKKQEDGNSSTVQLSAPLLSVAANISNAEKPSVASPVFIETNSNLTSETSGEGPNFLSNSSSQLPDEKCNKVENKTSEPLKPVVPPKPLKKKEAIRKERERLRQEQEALQREREEHRRKLMMEQEELMKNQPKSHAPDVPVTRLGILPPLVKPSLSSQITTPLSALPNARENATFSSRSHHGAQNGVGSIGSVEPIGHAVNQQNRMVSRGKTAQNETWGQQKVPSVRKQNQDSLTESRYNQNHWLIQEAEMRRITELKERQRANQMPYPQTHLAEDDVCSTSPRVPVLSPSAGQSMNYSSPEKHWNYGQPNAPVKNCPTPIKPDKPLTLYPREAVSHPPAKPSRVVPMERQEQMLSVSGRKRCSHCNEELGRGAAMIIESLQLYYHIHCFQCCVCQAQLGNGSCGTDVRVRNNKLHCHNCYSNDEAGLKFSQV